VALGLTGRESASPQKVTRECLRMMTWICILTVDEHKLCPKQSTLIGDSLKVKFKKKWGMGTRLSKHSRNQKFLQWYKLLYKIGGKIERFPTHPMM
jgi:hypothetical protein